MRKTSPWTLAAFALILGTGIALTTRISAQDMPADPPPPRDNGDQGDPGPPPDQNGPPRDQNGPPHGDRPLPPEQRAVQALNLTDDQKAKVDPILKDFQKKQDQLRDDLLAQMKAVLTAAQYQQFAAGVHRPPPRDGQAQNAPAAAHPASVVTPTDGVPVSVTGGHDTDPRDGGRPVVLIAAALNVPAAVFRETFTHVKPAHGGQEPDPAQVQLNKQALLAGLGPYGVTDDRLNTVSNFYRYAGFNGEMWRNTPAVVYAKIKDGTVSGFTIANPGAGYSSPPTVTVPGRPDLNVKVTLAYGTDFKTNGSIKEISILR